MRKLKLLAILIFLIILSNSVYANADENEVKLSISEKTLSDMNYGDKVYLGEGVTLEKVYPVENLSVNMVSSTNTEVYTLIREKIYEENKNYSVKFGVDLLIARDYGNHYFIEGQRGGVWTTDGRNQHDANWKQLSSWGDILSGKKSYRLGFTGKFELAVNKNYGTSIGIPGFQVSGGTSGVTYYSSDIISDNYTFNIY